MVINLVYFEVKSWFMIVVNQYVMIIYMMSFKLLEILDFINMVFVYV